MVMLSVMTDAAMDYLKVFKNAKAGKILKLTKFQKAFRIMKALRSVKIIQWCFASHETIKRLRNLFFRVLFCLPIVGRLTIVIFIVTYIYSIIGVEVFPTGSQEIKNIDSIMTYIYDDYSDFSTVFLGQMTLLQVITNSGWHLLTLSYAKKFDAFWAACLFFNSFHMITVLIGLSLLKGLIWEVFIIVDVNVNNEHENQAHEHDNEKKKKLTILGSRQLGRLVNNLSNY
jgi:two pore calcium channel protein 3